MDIFTFIIILVIIGAFKDVIKKRYQTSHFDVAGKAVEQEINDLRQRIFELENHPEVKRIEKRLQTLESIVVDSDYQLRMKFKKAFK